MAGNPRPIERTSLRFIFFISSLALLGVTAWAFWDEARSRRPWKDYQQRFNELEYQMVLADYQKAQVKLERPEVQQKLEKLKEELRWAEEALKGKAYKEAEKRLEALKREYADSSQQWQFIKSELEEAYYWYEVALKTKRGVEKARAEVDRLEKKEHELRKQVEDLEQKKGEAERGLEQYKERIQEIKERIAELEKPVRDLERRLEVIKRRPLEVKQVVVERFDMNEFKQLIDRVDRCQTCHLGIDRPGFEEVEEKVFRTHPHREVLLAAHPIGRFGCTACHQGQGPALDYAKLVDGPQRNPGRIPDAPHGYIPLWDFPMLKGELVQATCRHCHREQEEIPMAPAWTQGRALFEAMGCVGCHSLQGFEWTKVGPSLVRIKSKVDPSWMVRWIQNPKGYLPRGKMPVFGVSEDEAIAIAAYLLSASESEFQPLTRPPIPGDPKKGKELVGKLGCLGCHRVGNEFPPPPRPESRGPVEAILSRFDDAPDLGRVASKVHADWLFRWVKDPKHYNPKTLMPSLRLSSEEAAHVTAYLMTLGRKEEIRGLSAELGKPERIQEGERIIRRRGCFGCHDIKGFEKAERIAPDLSNFGRKRLLELFFGQAFDIPETWEDWTFHKLKNPQIYQTDRAPQIMPNFRFTDEEIVALRVFLKSLVAEEAPMAFRRELKEEERSLQGGRKLVRQYNCVGCHIIEGKGGRIAAYYEAPHLAPPPLEVGELHEGEKVQAPWLFEFLKRPIPLRPWLEVRMPTFGFADEEATTLARYFAILGKQRFPYEFFDTAQIPKEHLDAAKRLVSKEYLDCFSCHMQGERKPEGPPEGWAPDFALAKRRLRPDWIIKWLKDPQKIQPGTKMPTYFDRPDSGPEDILGGDEERQILALRNYLMTNVGR